MRSSSWRELVIEPGERKHLVLVHRSDEYLHACVAAWVARPLTTGGGAILIGREGNLRDIVRHIRLLGVDAEARIASGRLVLLDGEATLRTLLHEGHPDAARFDALAADALAKLRRACGSPHADVRGWGEMVSLLHEGGRPAEARELESIWERFLGREDIRLLCSYKMGGVADLADVCEEHATLVIEAEADIETTARRVLTQLYGERAAAHPLSHLVGHGALPIGGSPPRALLWPLDGWHRSRPSA